MHLMAIALQTVTKFHQPLTTNGSKLLLRSKYDDIHT